MRIIMFGLIAMLMGAGAHAQSEEYQQKKKEKLAVPSPFENIISGTEQRQIIYQDDYVVAFVPLRKQAPVHFLIVPKKRIPTLNDVNDNDAMLLGKMMLAARALAKDYGISETGYRVSLNTNENAGQSVFHIHLHLLGGMTLGPTVTQSYKE